jgi:phosphoribosylformimino-5-aminoimidazole carboxamide ribotide isomerase
MRVIPVLDLMSGRAVRARGGARSGYAPLHSVLVERDGDAVALAGAFRHTLGCAECYVADLDAITRGAPQWTLLERIAHVGSRLIADLGVTTPEHAAAALARGVERVVVGLETLSDFAALETIVRAHGRGRVVFSLDLRAGEPVVRPGAGHRHPPLTLVELAVRAGTGAVLVIDLARVGSGRGLDLELCGRIRRAHPHIELLAGGGVASPHDLTMLAATGCDGALVATALHDGLLDVRHGYPSVSR